MNLFKLKLGIAVSVLLSFAQSPVFAIPPYSPDLTGGMNQQNWWTIRIYDDSSPLHADPNIKLEVCFFKTGINGSHQQYDWVSIGGSTVYLDGRAVQEGDQVFMHGDFPGTNGIDDIGHAALQWQLTTDFTPGPDEGFGHAQGWSEVEGSLGTTLIFANIKSKRNGPCRHSTVKQALSNRPPL